MEKRIIDNPGGGVGGRETTDPREHVKTSSEGVPSTVSMTLPFALLAVIAGALV
jgi:hypothetical protein